MQSYKVFINEHLLLFDEKPSFNEQSISLLNLKADIGVNFKDLVKWLMNEAEPMQVVLFGKKTEAIWVEFKSCFQNIVAAGGVVRNENQEILFIKRLNKWDLPKGKVEDGESVVDAAIREVEEECGLTNLTRGEKLPSTFHMYELKESLILKETHWFEMKTSADQKLTPQIEEDIEEVKWVASNNMEEQLRNTYRSLKELLNRV